MTQQKALAALQSNLRADGATQKATSGMFDFHWAIP
jgi:hypothetical protein